MCIFTGPVDVCNTSIFARRLAGHRSDRQCLVYQMHYASKSPVAMVLPIPVLRPNETDAINFIDLKHYPDFFDHMHRAFPSRGGDLCLSAEPETLEVHKLATLLLLLCRRSMTLDGWTKSFGWPMTYGIRFHNTKIFHSQFFSSPKHCLVRSGEN